jgi:xylan 1,4-beta-xylosidase
LKDGGQLPPTTLDLPEVQLPSATTEHDFSGPELPEEFQWLRSPFPERLFKMTGTALRLTGRESLGSWFEQSLVARRQDEPTYEAEADLLADPPNWQRAVGLITYYNRHKFHAALVTREKGDRSVILVSCAGDWPGEALTFHGRFPIPDGKVTLGVSVDRASQQFRVNGMEVGPVLDASIVSDEGGRGEHSSFTGAFVGVVAYDLTGQGWTADVTRFRYAPFPA